MDGSRRMGEARPGMGLMGKLENTCRALRRSCISVKNKSPVNVGVSVMQEERVSMAP